MKAPFRTRKATGDRRGRCRGVVALVILARRDPGGKSTPTGSALAFSPTLDPGTRLPDVPAPDFTLTDQFDKPVSLELVPRQGCTAGLQ